MTNSQRSWELYFLISILLIANSDDVYWQEWCQKRTTEKQEEDISMLRKPWVWFHGPRSRILRYSISLRGVGKDAHPNHSSVHLQALMPASCPWTQSRNLCPRSLLGPESSIGVWGLLTQIPWCVNRGVQNVSVHTHTRVVFRLHTFKLLDAIRTGKHNKAYPSS